VIRLTDLNLFAGGDITMNREGSGDRVNLHLRTAQMDFIQLPLDNIR
jgi:hypothetical protein